MLFNGDYGSSDIDAIMPSVPIEIFIPEVKAYSLQQIVDILSSLTNSKEHQIIGMRPCEKQHESLINSDEIRYALSYENKFKLLNELHNDKNLEKTLLVVLSNIGIDIKSISI